MTAAAEVLAELGRLGVSITADAGTLWLSPASQVPPDLVAAVRAHKTELLALLSPADSEDWLSFFDECAAVAEHDGERSRPEAEQIAFKRCIAEWKRLHPPDTGSANCAGCGLALTPSATDVASLGDGAWVHWAGGWGESCWRAWCDRRHAEAIAALADAGIVDPLAEVKQPEA